jgi:hypothetical protein
VDVDRHAGVVRLPVDEMSLGADLHEVEVAQDGDGG